MKMNAIFNLTIVVAGFAVIGCQTKQSPSLVVLSEGYEIVANGVPPIGFLIPSPGQVIVTDTRTNSTVYSMDATRATGSILKVEDDKLIAMVPDASGTPSIATTLLSGLDAEHSYRIVFRPASAATRPGPTTRSTATTAPRR